MTVVRTGCVASLRVYEPLAAFEGPEREAWQRYADTAPRDDIAAGVAREREESLRALIGVPRLPELGPHAHVLEIDGVTLLSPWETDLRSQESLVDFCADLPDVVASAFVPEAVLQRAEVELDRWRAEHGSTASHVRTCTWQVPLRWFVLVEEEERDVQLGDPGEGGAPPTGRTLVYRTPMVRARRRVARALDVVRRSLGEDSVSEGLEDLGRWLEEFHPRSLVELDYGGLVHLLDDAELQQDSSARDVADALRHLAAGESEAAAQAYGRVTARMKALQAVEACN